MNRIAEKGWEKEVARLAVLRLAREARAEDLSEIVIPDGLRTRVEGLLKSERERLARQKIHRRAAVILIAALLAALTACMSIPAVREKLYEIAITFYDKYFTYQSVPVETEKPETAPGAVIGPVLTFEKRLPAYIPAGFDLYEDNTTLLSASLAWVNEASKRYISFDQFPVGQGTFMINSEGVEIRSVTVNGNPGIASVEETEYGRETVLVWHDDRNDYCLCGTVSLAEALRIAESVGKTDK